MGIPGPLSKSVPCFVIELLLPPHVYLYACVKLMHYGCMKIRMFMYMLVSVYTGDLY